MSTDTVYPASTPEQAAREYLSCHNVLSLATSVDNLPWVASVFYAIYDSSFIFLSAPHTRHCKALAVNTRVAAAIQEDYTRWEDIKGIQLEGKVRPVDDSERQAVIDCYAAKFPITGADAPAAIAKALDKISWYKLHPDRLYFIDNSRGLGHRTEFGVGLLQE